MNKLWVKGADGEWKKVSPLVKLPSSAGQAERWVRATKLYSRDATSWTLRETVDTTPGVTPTVTAKYNLSTRMVDVVVTTKDNRPGTLVMSASTTAYAASATTTSGVTRITDDVVAANASSGDKTLTYSVLLNGQLFEYIAAWFIPANGLASPRATAVKVSIPKGTVTKAPTKIVTKTITINVTANANYQNTTPGGSSTDNFDLVNKGNYAYQGGSLGYRGLFLYGTNIATALKNAIEITNATIVIQRSKSAIGTTGRANVWLGYHTYASAPKHAAITTNLNAGTLTRGQTRTFTIPKAWYDEMLSGKLRGFSLNHGATSQTDSDYLVAYGKGTASGRLTITYKYKTT